MSALGRAIDSKGKLIMDRHQEINRIIAQAKQQRAEYIASIARSHPLPLAVVAALSLVLLQFSTLPGSTDGPQVELAPRVSQLG